MITNQTIFIAHSWSDSFVNRQSKILAEAFSKNNKVIFFNAKKTGCPVTNINENLCIVEWPGKRPTGWKDYALARKLMKLHRPGIVITNFAANNIMLLAAKFSGVKVRMCFYHTLLSQLLLDHDHFTMMERFNIFRKKIIYSFATHLLPCSTAAKKDLIKYFGVPENKAFVFPNAVAVRGTVNKSIDKTVGFIGRFDHSKGVDLLIAAFEKVLLKVPDARLEIAGSGKLRSELQKQASALNTDKIKFTGRINHQQVFQFLEHIHCLVVPSRIDNLPTVVLEAFSTKTPVIASDAGGIPDMITNGLNGLLFEAGNTDALAKQIILMLTDKEQRNRMAGKGYEVFLDKFCVEQYYERFERLLSLTI